MTKPDKIELTGYDQMKAQKDAIVERERAEIEKPLRARITKLEQQLADSQAQFKAVSTTNCRKCQENEQQSQRDRERIGELEKLLTEVEKCCHGGYFSAHWFGPWQERVRAELAKGG